MHPFIASPRRAAAAVTSPTRRYLLLAAACAPLTGCASRAAPQVPSTLSAAALARAMAARPVVLLGEVHDNPVQHRERAEALAQRIA
ncbi:MAG: hypothetical protein MUC68_09580, partial [Burkholderiaceae bacterium]|nr:hypothetical protein [Burkholderiaceae bacterium]